MTSRPRSIGLVNGRIYRSAFDEAPPECMVVSNGKIIYSGAARHAPPTDTTIDLADATVIPGLTDAHIHLFAIAHARLQVPVTPRDAASIPAMLDRLTARARQLPPGKWVYA